MPSPTGRPRYRESRRAVPVQNQDSGQSVIAPFRV
jgi:hypothetical protein